MKWLTLAYVKEHCRIDNDTEDTLLTKLGNTAEEQVCNYVGMTYEEILEEYTAVPDSFYEAAALLVNNWYEHRSVSSQVNMSVVPYTFDFIMKPYVRLC